MRPLETLVTIANILTFLVLVVPRLRAIRWSGYVALLITFALTVVQILLEGPRWQMILMYTLTGLIICAQIFIRERQRFVSTGSRIDQKRQHATLPDNSSEQYRQRRRPRIITICAIIIYVVALIFSTALPAIAPVFSFPQPTGPYGIGTVTYHWTDDSRREVFSSDAQMRRELMVQIWYPASKSATASSSIPYIPDADAVTAAMAVRLGRPEFLLSHLKYVTVHEAASVLVANDQSSYPVLIFLEGLTGYRQMNTFQVEELVSHGYIVVGIDQPGAASMVVFPDGHRIDGLLPAQIMPLTDQSLSPSKNAPQWNGQTFPDGIIPYFAQDVSFTLDQLTALNTSDPQHLLTGRLDLTHSGVFGVSFGGMVAAQACATDPRLTACLIMDVAMPADVVQKGLQQPAMWITRPASTMRLERQRFGGWAEKDIVQTQDTMRAVYNQKTSDGYFIQAPGIFHIDCTDLDLLSPLATQLGLSGPSGSQRAHEIINAYTLAFFDKYTKGQSETLLAGSSASYPDVIFEKR